MALDVIAAGELYIDLIMSGFERWPAPGEEAFARNFQREPGGVAITAIGLAKLGTRVGVSGAVGANDGEWIVQRLASEGVDTSGIRRVANEFTGTTVAVSDTSDRAFFTYPGANRPSQFEVTEARHLHWAAPVDLRQLELARTRGMTISLDSGFAPADPATAAALLLVDLFFPNQTEAERITGQRDPEASLRWFERAGAKCVVLKLGASGAAMLVDGLLVHAQPPPVTAVDTTGAGDCFDAGFLHAWLRGHSPAACLKLANLCGALSTRALGGVAAFPTKDEIDGGGFVL